LLDRCTLLAWHKLNFLRSIIDDHHKLVAYCRDLSFVNEYPSVPLIIYLAVPKPGSLKVRECYSMPPSLRFCEMQRSSECQAGPTGLQSLIGRGHFAVRTMGLGRCGAKRRQWEENKHMKLAKAPEHAAV
jgi:hypothetical protein